ncbi:hypothetical protein N9Y42_07180 [Mariniblastus sp.]|nr:hypothetical protein [Mariniblastus sp.]
MTERTVGSEQLGSEQLGSEQLGSEQLGSEQLGSEQLGSEQLGTSEQLGRANSWERTVGDNHEVASAMPIGTVSRGNQKFGDVRLGKMTSGFVVVPKRRPQLGANSWSEQLGTTTKLLLQSEQLGTTTKLLLQCQSEQLAEEIKNSAM